MRSGASPVCEFSMLKRTPHSEVEKLARKLG